MIPAVPYMRLVKMFALAKGYRFFNFEDMMEAAHKYNEYCKIKN